MGKTSIAECVAEHTGRPLFPITCGDIGSTAESVEKNMERCFQMAHKWGCVLLLDEADVFLAERSKTDLERNALVSGMFILTHNIMICFADLHIQCSFACSSTVRSIVFEIAGYD